MGKKNLIIGAFSGYNFNHLKPWVYSIQDLKLECDKIMIVGRDTSFETREQLTKHGFSLVEMTPLNVPVHIQRWLTVHEFLKHNVKEYDRVVMTDLKDVYLQDDPFKWMERTIGEKKIVTGSESLLYKDESWGNQNLFDTFRGISSLYEKFKGKEIYNVGVLGGDIEYLADLFLHNFLLAIGNPGALDQGTFNILMHTKPYSDIVYFAKQHEGWACHAGTTVDPSKIDGFRPNLLEKEPVYKDGIVYTSTGKKFCMVHQYDRVPEWRANVMTKYNQEDPNSYFTYKTV
jgi:hypothetical protein